MPTHLPEKIKELLSARANVARLEIEIGRELGLYLGHTAREVYTAPAAVKKKKVRKGRSHLTEKQREEIRRLAKEGQGQSVLAKMFGLTPGGVAYIIKGDKRK